MGTPADIAIVNENLILALSAFSKVKPAGSVAEAPGMRLVRSGVDYGLFNTAVLSAPALVEGDFEQRIHRVELLEAESRTAEAAGCTLADRVHHCRLRIRVRQYGIRSTVFAQPIADESPAAGFALDDAVDHQCGAAVVGSDGEHTALIRRAADEPVFASLRLRCCRRAEQGNRGSNPDSSHKS